MAFEIRDLNPDGTPGGNVLYTDIISCSEIGGANWYGVSVDPQFEIEVGEEYAFVFKLKENPEVSEVSYPQAIRGLETPVKFLR